MNAPIKRYTTSIDDKNEYREYLVYEKDGVFVTECISWKIKDMIRSGGNQAYSQDSKTEKEAIEKYNELITSWEKQSDET